MMLRKFIPKDEEKRLQRLWDQIDKNGDGEVSYQEMLMSLTQIKNCEYEARNECDRLFNRLHLDKDKEEIGF